MSTSLFCQQKYNILAAVHAFSGNDCLVFWRGNKSHVKMSEFAN